MLRGLFNNRFQRGKALRLFLRWLRRLRLADSGFLGRAGNGIIADIRRDIFYKLQALPFDYFDNRPSGKIFGFQIWSLPESSRS